MTVDHARGDAATNRGSPSGWVVLLCALASAASCSRPDPPWAARPDGAVVDESKPFLPGAQPSGDQPSGPWLGDARASTAATANAASARPAISRVGGLWVSCYGNFKPTGEPAKDVMRLGLICGPANGMVKVGETVSGQVTATPPDRVEPPIEIEARAGGCYRIFAVASPEVRDLDVTVRSSRGSRLTADLTEDNWPIVDPARPFCSFEDDRWRVEVTVPSGSGRFALEVWALPPR